MLGGLERFGEENNLETKGNEFRYVKSWHLIGFVLTFLESVFRQHASWIFHSKYSETTPRPETVSRFAKSVTRRSKLMKTGVG